MKQRRVCATLPLSLDVTQALDGKRSSLLTTTATTAAAAPQPSEWIAFVRWSAEERENVAVRERLRRLLLPSARVDGDQPRAIESGRAHEPESADDVATRELAFDVLCYDASTELLCVTMAIRAAKQSSSLLSPIEFRAVVEALLKAARTPTLSALSRHLVARSISWRPRGDSIGALAAAAATVAASHQKCAIAALPIACLTLAIEYAVSPWRLAAVCRQWWRCVRDTPLHLSHHLDFALRRFDARAGPTFSTEASVSRTMRSEQVTVERASAQNAEQARIEREIFTRTVPARFRARTIDAKFRTAAFRSLPVVAHFLAHLIALRRVEITLRLDDTRSDAETASLDALDQLPLLGTLRITLEHALDRPADFDMHIPRLPSLTHLDCRTRALKARRGADSTDAPTLHIRCKSLRVLRLRGRGRGDRARAALPRIAWEDAQALEELSLDFGVAETDVGREYELMVFAQCLDVDKTEYDCEEPSVFTGAVKSTRFACSMQRLRRLAIAGHFDVPPHLAALETLRFREFVGRQERAWPTLTSVRTIHGRVDFMSDAVDLARLVAPSVTRVDLDAHTTRATAPQIVAMREFSAKLAAAGGALTWNGSATFPAFRVTKEEQELWEGDDHSECKDEFSDDEPEPHVDLLA